MTICSVHMVYCVSSVNIHLFLCVSKALDRREYMVIIRDNFC